MKTETKPKKKASKPLVIIVAVLFAILFIVLIATSGGDKDNDSNNTNNILHGELIEVNEYADLAVVKVKIDSSWNNEMTIEQNYFNVADLIKNKGYDKYNEIKYWAVGEATNGEEIKLVQFTVNNDLITKIKNEQVLDSQLGDYVDDLWIHNDLK